MMINASFFDGRNAHLHPVRLSIGAGMLTVTASSFQRSYPLATVGRSEPFAAAPAVLRLQDGASCEVAAGSMRDELLAALGYRKSAVVRWQERWPAALLALVLLAGLLALGWFRGIPLVAERIAEHLPPSVDVSVGKASLASLEKQGLIGPSRLSDERIADIQALLPAVTPAHGRMPLRLLVRNSPQLGPNALALSDGTIVVTDALVRLVLDNNELTDDGKAQLIAVLGHEVGHVEHRHVVRVMARSSLAAALSATLFGDFSAVAAGLPAILSQMQYSREMELDADAYTVQLLRRQHLSVGHFADVLSALQEAQGEGARLPRWMQQSMGYLSTHPDTEERIARLETEIQEEEAPAPAH